MRTKMRISALFVVMALVVAACGGESATETTAGNESPDTTAAAVTTEAPDTTAGSEEEPPSTEATEQPAPSADDLPEALASQYVEIPDYMTAESAYADFEAVEGPWEVCYSESFVGNAWRVALADEMERLANEYEEAGLVSGFTMAVAESDIARQNQQIRQFTDQGCDIIYVVPGSTTGLNEAIQDAYDKGIPVVTITGSESPYAQVVDSNYYVLGANLAEYIAENASDGGVIQVKGIDGAPVAVAQNEGAAAVWEETGVQPVAEVNGDWTPSTTKSAVLNVLATNPIEISAVWTTGSETAVVAQAFEESGRPTPLITGSISGDAIGYWKENPDRFNFWGVALMPSWTAQTAFRVGMRLLDGQKPFLQTIMVPVPTVTQEDMEGMYEECMTPEAGSIFPVVPNDPLPPELMDAYFADSTGEVGPFDYANTPNPCESAG